MQASERAPSTHRPATRSRIVAIPAQCPMISARHSVPPSERKGRFDICQLQRPAMMVEYRTALYWKASRFRVGSALRQLRGHDGGRTEHQRHEQDRRANQPCTAWERAARTVPSTCHCRACATVCLPSLCRGTVFCKNWLKMDRYRREGIGGVINIRGTDRTHAWV